MTKNCWETISSLDEKTTLQVLYEDGYLIRAAIIGEGKLYSRKRVKDEIFKATGLRMEVTPWYLTELYDDPNMRVAGLFYTYC
jgi:hypothetical protein